MYCDFKVSLAVHSTIELQFLQLLVEMIASLVLTPLVAVSSFFGDHVSGIFYTEHSYHSQMYAGAAKERRGVR